MAALDLYAGDHWSVARTLPTRAGASGLRPQLWVASAGYGVVSAAAALRPYSATFSSGPDSVAVDAPRGPTRDEQLATWWRCLAEAPGPAPGEPRTLAALATLNRNARVLVVASAAYLRAMELDLLAARETLADPTRLLIISSGGRALCGALAPNIVATDARLQPSLGGARHALGARIAAAALDGASHHGLAPASVRERFDAIAHACPGLPTYDRAPMTDDEVRRYIRKHLRRDPTLTHSRLLRQCRGDGHACEQRRFRDLFLSVREAL